MTEVVGPERLVCLNSFFGNTAEGTPEMVIAVTFSDQDGKTLVTMHTLFATADDRAKTLEMGMEQGLGESLDRLAEHLAGA